MLRTTLFHSLPESIEMAAEMGTISLLSMMGAKRSDSKVTSVHKTRLHRHILCNWPGLPRL